MHHNGAVCAEYRGAASVRSAGSGGLDISFMDTSSMESMIPEKTYGDDLYGATSLRYLPCIH